MYETSIDLSDTRTVCVNEAYLAICDGNYCAAMILRHMQHLYDCGRVLADQAAARKTMARYAGVAVYDPDPSWVYMTAEAMSRELLGTYRRRSVQDALSWLAESGLLERRSDPDFKQQPYQYRFCVDRIRDAIAEWRHRRSPEPPAGGPGGRNLITDSDDDQDDGGTGAKTPQPPKPPFSPGSQDVPGGGKSAGASSVAAGENEPGISRESDSSTDLASMRARALPSIDGKTRDLGSGPPPSPQPPDPLPVPPGIDSSPLTGDASTNEYRTAVTMLEQRGFSGGAIHRMMRQQPPLRVLANIALYDRELRNTDPDRRPGKGWLVTAIRDDIAAEREDDTSTAVERYQEREQAAANRIVTAPRAVVSQMAPPGPRPSLSERLLGGEQPASPDEARATLELIKSKLAARLSSEALPVQVVDVQLVRGRS